LSKKWRREKNSGRPPDAGFAFLIPGIDVVIAGRRDTGPKQTIRVRSAAFNVNTHALVVKDGESAGSCVA
jgi:hypothetical protein